MVDTAEEIRNKSFDSLGKGNRRDCLNEGSTFLNEGEDKYFVIDLLAGKLNLSQPRQVTHHRKYPHLHKMDRAIQFFIGWTCFCTIHLLIDWPLMKNYRSIYATFVHF